MILSIILAAAAMFVLGFLWHGPLFGKTWMRLANITPTGNEKLSDMQKQMLLNFLADIVLAGVLYGAIKVATTSSLATSETTWLCGVTVAAFLWLGFVVAGSSPEVIWMGRSKKLWLFELSSSLVGLVAAGAILAGMM